jgi:hypothetical protein
MPHLATLQVRYIWLQVARKAGTSGDLPTICTLLQGIFATNWVNVAIGLQHKGGWCKIPWFSNVRGLKLSVCNAYVDLPSECEAQGECL